MTLAASQVEVGRCYTTGHSEVRRVVHADITEVKYKSVGTGAPSPIVCVTREKFAAEVDREIECPDQPGSG